MKKTLFMGVLMHLFVVPLAFGQRQAEVAFTIKEKDLIPEGIAYDSVDGVFYVGSIYKQKIVRIAKNGQVTDFVPAGQQGLLQVLGMKVDANRKLWACNNSPEQDTLNGISNIHVYDLKNGTLLKKYQLEEERKRHLFNDLYITAAGDVYVTDSYGGGVYVIRKGSETIDEFIKPGTLDYPNGITATTDEKKLLVATGSEAGIVSVDLATRQITSIRNERYWIVGVDGLYRYKNALIAMQNTTFPESVLALQSSDDFNGIDDVRFLAATDSRFDAPTTGVIAGHHFYFIANSQLLQLRSSAEIRYPETLRDIVIMRVMLP